MVKVEVSEEYAKAIIQLNKQLPDLIKAMNDLARSIRLMRHR